MAGSVILSILSTYNSKGTKEAETALAGLSKSVGNMTKHLAAGYGAWQLYNAGIGFIKSSVAAANDLQRAQNGLQTVFQGMTPAMNEYAANSEKIGLSHAEVARSSTLVGALFRNLDFPLSQTVKQTQKVINISADLASTYGGSTSDAIMAVTSAFKGIYRPLEKYGIGISANIIKTELAAKGLGKLRGEALLAATMQQRYLDVVSKSNIAQGAFARQVKSLFEQLQILRSVFTDLQATVGQAMLEPLGALTEVMVSLSRDIGPHLVSFFDVLSNVLTGGTNSWGGFANSIMTFIDAISAVIASFGPGFLFLLQVFTSLLAPIIAVTTAIKVGIGVYKGLTAITAVLTLFKTKEVAATVAETEAVVAKSAVEVENAAILGYLTKATEGATIAEMENAAALGGVTAAAEGATVATEGFALALDSTGIGAIAVAVGTLTAGLLGLAAVSGSMLMNKPSAAAEAAGNAAYKATVKFWGGVSNTKGELPSAAEAARDEKVFNLAETAKKKAIDAQMAKEKAAAAKASAAGIAETIKKSMAAVSASLNNGTKTVDPVVAAAEVMKKSFATASQAVSDALSASYNSIVGAFDITQFGASKDTMAQNMQRFMDRLRQFAGYIKQLKAANLNPALIAQIIAAGPMNGMAAAAALAGNSDLRMQADTSYAEVGSLAKDIAKSSLNKQQEAIYNITVNGGIGTGTSIGKSVVEAIKAYERTNGKGWRN